MADNVTQTDAPIADKVAEAVATETPAEKPAAKKAVKKTAKKAAKSAANKSPSKSKTKEPIMATKQTKTTKNSATDQAKAAFADLSTRAQGAYDKSREYAGEAVEFSKGNVEAVVESGKILAEGMQGMAKNAIENGRETVSTMTADAKDFAAVRSPSELVQLNSTIASRNFDAMVAQSSKNFEAFTKLATEAFMPIQNRVSIAVEKARKAA